MLRSAFLLGRVTLMSALIAYSAHAQTAPTPYLDADQKASIIPGLDPTHVFAVKPADLKWHKAEYSTRAMLWGNPDKPGPYGYLIRFEPGHNSSPHFHDRDRQGFVLSGTFYNSTSPQEDRSTLKPVPAGSYVDHIAGKVHWDGALDGEVLILMTGIGPVSTTRIPQKK
jgi:quercetin dioxygenase-like cupin family protein